MYEGVDDMGVQREPKADVDVAIGRHGPIHVLRPDSRRPFCGTSASPWQREWRIEISQKTMPIGLCNACWIPLQVHFSQENQERAENDA